MMTCFILGQIPPPLHGSSIMTITLREILEQQGFEVKVISRDLSNRVGEIGKLTPIKILNFFKLCKRSMQIRNEISAKDTLILFTTNRTLLIFVDLIMAGFGKKRGTHIILYLHTRDFARIFGKGFVRKGLFSLLCKKANHVVILSSLFSYEITQFAHPNKIVVIPNTLLNTMFKHDISEKGIPSNLIQMLEPKSYLLYLSNLLPEKGARDFVDFALLTASENKYTFVLAGSNTEQSFSDEINDVIQNSPYSDRFLILGAVEASVGHWLISNCKIFFFPSTYRYEAQPLVLIQAIALGIPVIAYDNGAVKEIVRDGKNGFCLENRNPEQLQKAFNALEEHFDLYHMMSRAGKAHYSENYSKEQYISSWLDLINCNCSRC